jgi:glucokinase
MSQDSVAIGVDLGGSKILTAVVNTGGKILASDYRPTPANRAAEVVVQEILNSADHALELAGIPPERPCAIGVAAAGISNPETGIVYASPHLPEWRNVPLRDIIEKRSAKKTLLMNDANAAAVAELHFGAGRGARNFVFVTVSTGIGGGIIINGELYAGAIGAAGEIGHMTVDDNGPQCNCGNQGCWETLASGSALAREAKSQIQQGASTSILDYAGGDMQKVTAEIIHTAAINGDALAKELIARAAYYLGVGFANLINIFNPERIIIGGGLSNMGDMLLLPAYEVVEKRSFKEPYHAVRFALAELGVNSGVIGAAAFALGKVKTGGE